MFAKMYLIIDKGVTIYQYIGILHIILPIRYTGTLNENTRIYLQPEQSRVVDSYILSLACLMHVNR